MFDGVSDQLHQFIAASRTSLPVIPSLNFPLHGNTTIPNFSTFETYPSSKQQSLQSHLLHPLHHKDIEEERDGNNLLCTNLELEREKSVSTEPIDPWSSDEVLALLRIRSSMENWFIDFNWEHVSRKLAELGFNRSAEKCKEKFEEEESRYFNNTNINYNKMNYRFFGELEELCHSENSSPQIIEAAEKIDNEKTMEKPNEEEDKMGQIDYVDQEDSRNDQTQSMGGDHHQEQKSKRSKKRKRHQKFEMMKCFCEEIVSKMMTQQEELHNKLLENMAKRDEENIAREEAWKKQEMDRINKEIEMKAHEQAIAGDRQATIIEFLKKFTQNNQCFVSEKELMKVPNSSDTPNSPPTIQSQNPNLNQNKFEAPTSSSVCFLPQNPSSCPNQINPNLPTSYIEISASRNPSSSLAPNISNVPISSTLALDAQNPNSINSQNIPSPPTSNSTYETPQNPNSLNAPKNPSAPTSNSTHKAPKIENFASNVDKDDHGKRWPRDEVLALINLRCNLYNNNEDKDQGSTANKHAPLWERISQGMLDLGYKRSAKRCKEKWENINKYFRKTKDVNKKRSLDSRTCPYFHQLSSLYNQVTPVAPSNGPENHPSSPGNLPDIPETNPGFLPSVSSNTNLHVGQGEKNMIHAPSFEFEF